MKFQRIKQQNAELYECLPDTPKAISRKHHLKADLNIQRILQQLQSTDITSNCSSEYLETLK